MSWSVPVYSSNVSEVGFDSDNNDLIIKWLKSGKVSAYAGVDEGTALSISRAPSVGQAINQDVKPYYSHRYI